VWPFLNGNLQFIDKDGDGSLSRAEVRAWAVQARLFSNEKEGLDFDTLKELVDLDGIVVLRTALLRFEGDASVMAAASQLLGHLALHDDATRGVVVETVGPRTIMKGLERFVDERDMVIGGLMALTGMSHDNEAIQARIQDMV
jgi:hypothetical protein